MSEYDDFIHWFVGLASEYRILGFMVKVCGKCSHSGQWPLNVISGHAIMLMSLRTAWHAEYEKVEAYLGSFKHTAHIRRTFGYFLAQRKALMVVS